MEIINRSSDDFTHNMVYSTLIPVLNEYDTFDAFAEHVWWGGGGAGKCGQIKLGDNKTLKGAIRSVPGTHEEVLNSMHGKFIEYTLKNNYIFPVKKHLGRITFEKQSNGTKITWFVQYTPILGMNWMCRLMLSMLPTFLSHLHKKTSPQKRASWKWVVALLICLLAVIGGLFRTLSLKYSTLMHTPPLMPGSEYISAIDNIRRHTSDLDETIQKYSFLVIGASGFTGSALVDELLARGARTVRLLLREHAVRPNHPYPSRLKDNSLDTEVEEWLGDVTNITSLLQAMGGVDVVFLTAAAYGSPSFTSMGSGGDVYRVNVGGMLNVIDAARKTHVKQIIYTSTCDTVFTGRTALNVTEISINDDSMLRKEKYGGNGYYYAVGEDAVGDHYSRTKIIAEQALLAASSDTLRTTALRPNGIYGPGENNNFPRAIVPALLLGGMPFYFDSDQHADWTCIYNLVFAHVLAVNSLAGTGMGATNDHQSVVSSAGRAYFITDMESFGPHGQLWGSANWGIFTPVLRTLGVAPNPIIRIPPRALLIWTNLSEKAAFWLKYWTGVDLTAGLLTHKEALKVLTTHTHDCSSAQRDLGYYPVLSTSQCMEFTAEEFRRRYACE